MNAIQQYDDSSLAKGIKSGSKEAFKKLFDIYSPKIHQFSLKFFHSTEDAEELVQDVFLKLWDKRSRLDSEQNIKSYLFKIAVNTIYDLVRRKNLENAYKDLINKQFNVKNDSTWEEVVYNEMKSNLGKLIAMMPEQRKIIFKLSREEGLSHDEIAKKLNISKRTVENQVFRAIAFLKKHLDKGSIYTLLFFYIYYS